jgi:hypothetical protein
MVSFMIDMIRRVGDRGAATMPTWKRPAEMEGIGGRR